MIQYLDRKETVLEGATILLGGGKLPGQPLAGTPSTQTHM